MRSWMGIFDVRPHSPQQISIQTSRSLPFAFTRNFPVGYVSPAIRHPFKKPEGGQLTEAQTTYNTIIRGVHGVAERAHALFKETFATLQLVSLSPARIGAIAKAALVLLHLEHDRPGPVATLSYGSLPGRAHQ
jgi:DDE superfamily endonuclease